MYKLEKDNIESNKLSLIYTTNKVIVRFLLTLLYKYENTHNNYTADIGKELFIKMLNSDFDNFKKFNEKISPIIDDLDKKPKSKEEMIQLLKSIKSKFGLSFDEDEALKDILNFIDI